MKFPKIFKVVRDSDEYTNKYIYTVICTMDIPFFEYVDHSQKFLYTPVGKKFANKRADELNKLVEDWFKQMVRACIA